MHDTILKPFLLVSLLFALIGCPDASTSGDDEIIEGDTSSGVPAAVPQSRFTDNEDVTVTIGDYVDVKGGEVNPDVIQEIDAPAGECQGNENCAQDNLPPCTMAVCLNGSCEIVAGQDGLPCDDDNVCTEETLCNAAQGGCVGGSQTECDDNDACTVDSCDPLTGCTHSAGSGECDDGNICTVGDLCENGICNAGELIACNDDNPCTEDQCDPVLGCLYPSLEGKDCDDGEECTVNDTCVNGSCEAGELECEPCDENTPCLAPDNLCLGSFTCSPSGYCVAIPATVINCDDQNSCTDDTCTPETGDCAFTTLEDNSACDDGNDCTLDDTCTAGDCTSTNFAAGGSICEDGDPCTLLDTCEGGICYSGTADAGCTPGCVESPLLAGCNGCSCEDCVCDIDPVCCDSQWDASCVSLCDNDCDGCSLDPEGGEGGTEGGTEGGGNLPPGECAGNCGGSSPSLLCSCDDACFGYGDCCDGICNDCPTLASCGGGTEGGTEGGGVCAAGEILDCDGVCGPQSWLGDFSCDEGAFGPNFNCAALNYDNGDCGSGACGLFEIVDCDGGCTTESWVGDFICDPSLDCAQFNFDGGDCAGSSGGGGPSCGNGIVEVGETCDGDCPFSDFDCPDVDGDPCTEDMVVGDYFSCTSECVSEPITTCSSFDGCCLAECSWPDDLDCAMPICGDGILNGTEKCDGDCPTQDDCDLLTTDACMPYLLKGSANACSAECLPKEVITCSNDDGCCPASCEGFTGIDNDCDESGTGGEAGEEEGGETDGGTGEEGGEEEGGSGGDEECLPGEVKSCSGFTCVDETWIGDGSCDDSLLNCAANQFDGGDCPEL